MYNIVALAGPAGSGKDTAAQGLVEIGYKRVAFGDVVRDFLYAQNPIIFSGPFGFNKVRLQALVDREGWDKAKRYTEVRELLQRTGTEAGRKVLGERTWIEAALKNPTGKIVVTDVRFDNEAKAIIALGGTVVKIEKPGVGPVNGHVSETPVSQKYIDYTIYNIGSKQLLQQRLQAISYGAT